MPDNKEDGAVILPFTQGVDPVPLDEVKGSTMTRIIETHKKFMTAPSYSLEAISERLNLEGDRDE